MDIAQFRLNFPEFTSTTAYPNTMIQLWATLGEALLVECRWGDVYDQGLQLYVAHQITLARQNAAAGAIGGTPGQSGGPPQSKAVGGVNVAYDSQVTSYKDAGWWNLTTYGKQFYMLMRMLGAGAIQL